MPSLTARFSPRPAATFLIRADRATFRLDLRRRNERWEILRLLVGPEIAPETSYESAPDWIGPLLKTKRPAADIHILTTECRTHYTELPDAPRADQLPEVLGLEAEQISGLPVGDFILAHRALRSSGTAPVYHLTWIEWERALSLRELARRHGCRLASIGHPGGFRLADTPQIEDWPEVSQLLPGEGAEAPPQAWHGAEAAAEARAASNRYDAAAPVILDLSDPKLRDDWTRALIASLDRSAPTFAKHALVPIPEAPVSGGKQIAIGAAAGLVAALLVFAHHSVQQQKTVDLRDELTQLRAPREELSQLERERTALRRELTDLRRQGGSADQAAALFTRGPFIASLLDGLTDGIDERSVVARLSAEAGVQRIEGITLHPEAPYALARHLAALPPLNSWDIHLESRTALLTHENGGPWAFVLRVGPPPPPPAEANRRNTRRR